MRSGEPTTPASASPTSRCSFPSPLPPPPPSPSPPPPLVQVGRVLREVEELGLAEETVVLVLGDHGLQLGEHSEWDKYTNFEVTENLIFRGKPRLRTGRRCCCACLGRRRGWWTPWWSWWTCCPPWWRPPVSPGSPGAPSTPGTSRSAGTTTF